MSQDIEIRDQGPKTGQMSPAIAAAITSVMGQVGTLGKDGDNRHASYRYVSVDKFFDVVGRLMAKEGIFVIVDEISTHVERGEKSAWLAAEYELFLCHSSGSIFGPIRRKVRVVASGPQAYGAAASFVEKYFLRSLFKVPTGDEDIDAVPSSILPVQNALGEPRQVWSAPQVREEAIKRTQDAADAMARAEEAGPDELESLEARPRINPVQNALGEPRAAWSTPRVMELPQAAGSPPAVKSEAPGTHYTFTPEETEEIEAALERRRAREEAVPVDENPTPPSPSTSETQSTEASGDISTGTESAPPTSLRPNEPPISTSTAETAASTVPPEPTDSADYEAYCVSWVGKCEHRQDARAEWTAQRKLRNKLQVPMEMIERCKVLIEAAFPRTAEQDHG